MYNKIEISNIGNIILAVLFLEQSITTAQRYSINCFITISLVALCISIIIICIMLDYDFIIGKMGSATAYEQIVCDGYKPCMLYLLENNKKCKLILENENYELFSEAYQKALTYQVDVHDNFVLFSHNDYCNKSPFSSTKSFIEHYSIFMIPPTVILIALIMFIFRKIHHDNTNF